MFPYRQREDLRLAFESTDITDLILIDEGSAASIATIFQRREEALRDDYRLLVYDFGGGTIDVVLSQVTSNNGEIKFEPLASGGNPTYGGDDVTQAIVDAILDELKSQLRSANPELRFDIPYFKPRKILQPSENPEIDRATRFNSAILYSSAERMKREFNEETETDSFFALSVVVANDVHPLENLTRGGTNVKLSLPKLQKLLEPALNKTFDDIDAMIADNGEYLPDIVILAGQSSKMRVVQAMMDTHFKKKYGKNIDIRLGVPPKECVVLGAAEYGRHHTVPDTEGDWVEYSDLDNKTHSRLGIVRVIGRQPVFGEIIPKGKRIPNDSCNTIDFPLRSRSTFIDVHEHFGTDNDLENAYRVASYTLILPEDIPKVELRNARLQMSVEANGKIELIALIGDVEYRSIVHKTEPEFVNEI